MKRSVIIAATLLFLMLQTLDAKTMRWAAIRNKNLVTFDWNCSQPQTFPAKKLQKLASQKIPKEARQRLETWVGRAFAFKLSAQASTVYFVPLTCGATGNCEWGLFSTNPNKYFGQIGGQYIHTYKSINGWPQILTDTRVGGDERILTTYEFRGGRYRQLGKEISVKSTEPLKPPNLPSFLRKSKIMCKDYGG